MDKEDVVHMYNGILLIHLKDWKRAVCRDIDGPRINHIELRKRENNKYHSLTQVCAI